ncbi:homoserine kinase [Algoriphagus sediminis]|uniref:Homoserine kinase n=1 Tax=Algoriphagus sediminis TaxID=3057113 RepID=A0ABT7YF31_9BACT|nr:homoserine kinase [Algoriphagus sediminis]MDN3205076.1 homoserine kinase [Algoriphagus sediminis]
MEKVKAFAPATVANVSCGFDILGFALDSLGDHVILSKNDEKVLRVISIKGDGGRLPLEADKNTCSIAIRAMLDDLGSDQGFDIELEKGLPLGSGMGSSAASAVAALVAVNELLGNPYPKNELLPFAMEAERAACGTAHADNVAPSLLGGFVLIRGYKPLDVIKLSVPDNLTCTLLHPNYQLNTSDSRSVLKDRIPLKDAITQSGNVAGLVAGLFQSDYALISRSLEDVIAEPYRASLLPGFDEVKKAMLELGALGLGISGSGPTLFILSEGKEKHEHFVQKAKEIYDNLGLSLKAYFSRINTKGGFVIQ